MVVLTEYNSGDQIKNEMVRACSTCGREVHTGFCWVNLREVYHLKDPGINGKIILKWIFKVWDGGHTLDSSG